MIHALLTHFSPVLLILAYTGTLALVVWILNHQDTKDGNP